MKATDFNFKKELKFDFDRGEVTFRDNRVIILDTNAIGMLRYKLIEQLGFDEARALFLQMGYVNGFSDFMQFKTFNNLEDYDTDLLQAGPMLHSWEGIVKAEPKEMRFNKDKGEFYFSGIWKSSYECEQHLTFYEIGPEPVCWSLMGYSSGWASAFFGSKLISIEPVCVAKGDDHCEWLIQPPEAWDYAVAKPYIDALKEF